MVCTNWENTCATVFIGGLCHKDTSPPSSAGAAQIQLLTWLCTPAATLAEVGLSPLLGHNSRKTKEKKRNFLWRGIGWRTREEKRREHQLKHFHIQTSASSQPDSALVLWVDLPTGAPSVFLSLPFWLIPASLPRPAAHHWGPRAVMGKHQPKGVLLNWTELQWRFQRWVRWFLFLSFTVFYFFSLSLSYL